MSLFQIMVGSVLIGLGAGVIRSGLLHQPSVIVAPMSQVSGVTWNGEPLTLRGLESMVAEPRAGWDSEWETVIGDSRFVVRVRRTRDGDLVVLTGRVRNDPSPQRPQP